MKDDAGASEGARNFAVFLQQINDGAAHAELSEVLHEIGTKLRDFVNQTDTAGKADLTIKLSFKAERNGSVSVSHDIKSKLPKLKPVAGLFWLTQGANFSAEHPRQQKLPLREVPAPTTETRNTDTAPAVNVRTI